MRSIRLNSFGIKLLLAAGASGSCGFKLALDPGAVEYFDLVTDLDVIAFYADATFHAAADFGHVVLEAAQGFQLALKDHHVVPQYPDGLVTVDGTLGDHAACHLAILRRTEHITDIGDTDDILAVLRCQHAGQCCFDVIDQVVDDAVVAQIQTFLLDQALGCSIRPHVEAEYNRIGCHRQTHVCLGNTTNAGRYDLDLHFFVTQIL